MLHLQQNEMEKREKCVVFWNQNERNHGKIEISVLETSFKGMEDRCKTAGIIKHNFLGTLEFQSCGKLGF